MSLLTLILTLMAGVGFTEAVCGTPATMFHGVPDSWESVSNMSMTLLTLSPCRSGIRQFHYGWNLAGNNASFSKVNQHCLGVVTKWCKQFLRVVYALQHP